MDLIALPSTELQQRMVLGERFDPHGRRYATGIAFEIEGDLDVARFREAFARVVADLDALSLVLVEDSRALPFRAQTHVDRGLPFLDLSIDPSPRHALRRWLGSWFPPRLDCAQRLFDAHLLRVTPTQHVFAFAGHHAITDGRCYSLLMERLAAHYRGDRVAPAPSYIEELQRRAAREVAKRVSHPIQSPFPFTSSVAARYAAGTLRFERRLGRERTQRLRELARSVESGRSDSRALTETLFGLIGAYLARRYSLERFEAGFPLHGRTSERDRATFGLFMAPTAVEFVAAKDATLASAVRDFRSVLRSELTGNDHSLPERPYDIAFNAHTYRFTEFAGLPMRARLMHRGSDPIPLQFHLRAFERQSVSLVVDANRAEFTASEALRTIQRVLHVVDRFLAAPDTPIADLEIVAPRERARILACSTGARVSTPIRRIDESLLAATVEFSIVHGAQTTLRHEFLGTAKAIAANLTARGIGSGAVVAIRGERSPDQVAAFVGVTLSGAAFLPLDPRWPESRTQRILEDANVAAILDGRELTFVDAARRPLEAYASESPDAPLYLLYTSGSSGEPKGVIGTHRGLMRRIEAFDGIAPVRDDDVHLLRTPIGFVDAIAEIFVPLLRGGRAILLDDAELRDPDRVLAAIERHGVTRCVITPSMLRAVLDRAKESQLDSLRLVMTSGEECPSGLVREFVRRVPNGRILNVYGSTEVAADVTVFDATRNVEERVPIGVPIAGSEAFVCDEHMNLSPFGAVGELIVAGECLALGYHARPEEQRARFIPHPLDPSRRAFRTGDYARLREEGAIEYHGRRDRQVKIRGVRIELEEIEAAIATFPGVREVAVERNEPGGSALVAFVVAGETTPLDHDALRSHLAARVPSQGIPREFVECARLPRMSHGKVDRTALRAVRSESPAMRATATTSEQRILAIFTELLGSPAIDRGDDFFTVGGDSLLAVDAVISLERAFARPITIAEFMKDASASGLARYFESEQPASEPQRLPRIVRLGGPEHGTPIVCVPPAGSDPSCFLALARRLEAKSKGPILGLVPLGIEQGETPDDRVETIADHYLRALDAALVSRRIRLIGRCFGGIVAFEMARRAERFGFAVDRLVLLDTRRPPGVAVEPRRGRLALIEGEDASERNAVVLRRRVARAAHFDARAKYQGGPTRVPSVLVHCGDGPESCGPQQAWTRFFQGPLRVRQFPGEHKNLMREPRVVELGEFLEQELAAPGS